MSHLVETVQFGEAAVASSIAAVRQGHYRNQDTVLFALRPLLEGRPAIAGNPAIAPAQLSATSKQQIRDLASDLLKPKALKQPVTLRRVAQLALATGDPDLRQQVQVLVDLPSKFEDRPNKDGVR